MLFTQAKISDKFEAKGRYVVDIGFWRKTKTECFQGERASGPNHRLMYLFNLKFQEEFSSVMDRNLKVRKLLQM